MLEVSHALKLYNFFKKTKNEGKHVPVTMEFAVAGSVRTAAQPRRSFKHTTTVPVKGNQRSSLPRSVAAVGVKSDEDTGFLRAHRARAGSEDGHQPAGLREGGLVALEKGRLWGSQEQPPAPPGWLSRRQSQAAHSGAHRRDAGHKRD